MRAKLKAFGIPLLLIVLLIGALFFHQLLQVKKQPHSDWSRSMPLNYTSEERPVSFLGEEALFLASNGKITGFSLEDPMGSSKGSTLETSVTRGYPFWTDGNMVIHFKEGQIISTQKKEETVLAEEATDISTTKNTIYYWNNDRLFSLDPDDLSVTEVYRFSGDILQAYIGDTGSAIIQVRIDDGHAHLFYLT
ncbi:hypothetical protein LS684_23685 (plasmid) [Cytobacillus spongiae]|uniref:hypothetical protein n=1 Tax=Cytobacillus spongiae TaxID=2901381 RepID=UPI001F23C8E0|nr:hypothetical protein [Cytobacillus spongiae]UII58591.1 hypothetical protein LS684_23685 [Cytobacillus spongiae]